jgi:hypothetical protein
MPNIARMSAPGGLLQKVVSHSFPAWIDASEYGVAHSFVIPRVRDNLVLRLVAGRRQGRPRSSHHAHGAP